MHDIREHVLNLRKTLTTIDESILKAFDLPLSLVSETEKIVASIDQTYSAFDQDELAYLEYRRHVECHPLQHGYEILVRDGAIIDRPRNLTGRLWTYEEENAALRRVFRKHGKIFAAGPDETAIAVFFAQRLAPLLGTVEESLVPIFGNHDFSWEPIASSRPAYAMGKP